MPLLNVDDHNFDLNSYRLGIFFVRWELDVCVLFFCGYKTIFLDSGECSPKVLRASLDSSRVCLTGPSGFTRHTESTRSAVVPSYPLMVWYWGFQLGVL